MEYVKTVAYLNGVAKKQQYGDHREYFKRYDKDWEIKLEFDWVIFNEHNPGIVKWMDVRPEHKFTRSAIFDAIRVRLPDEAKTKDDIIKFINEHVEEIVSKDKAIRRTRQNGRTFTVEVSDIEYGSCTYRVPVTYSFDIEIPEDVIAEGTDAINDYIYENYTQHSDPDYGDYEYDDHESSDYNGATIDSISPDPQDVIDEMEGEDGDGDDDENW